MIFAEYDVYRIADYYETLIICEPLGEIQGYFHIVESRKMIHVNESLNENQRRIIICKFLHSMFTGKEFELIYKESELTKSELFDMTILNDFFVRYVFAVSRLATEQLSGFEQITGNSLLKSKTKKFMELLKTVS